MLETSLALKGTSTCVIEAFAESRASQPKHRRRRQLCTEHTLPENHITNPQQIFLSVNNIFLSHHNPSSNLPFPSHHEQPLPSGRIHLARLARQTRPNNPHVHLPQHRANNPRRIRPRWRLSGVQVPNLVLVRRQSSIPACHLPA